METTLISLQKKLLPNLILLPQHYVNGRMTERLDTSDLNLRELIVEQNDCTALAMSRESLELTMMRHLQKYQFVMLELVLHIKNQILRGKWSTYDLIFHHTKLLPTLALDLIGSDQELRPYWNRLAQTLSQNLWLPIKTDCVDSDLNFLSGFYKNTMLNSWFSTRQQIPQIPLMNSQKICSQLLLSLLQKITELDQPDMHENERNEDDENEDAAAQYIHTHRIRIYPTLEQRKTLNNWFGATRWIYNRVNNFIRDYYLDNKKIPTIKIIGENCIKNSVYQNQDQWMLAFDFELRDQTAIRALKNYKSNLALHKGKHTFEIKNKEKKDPIQSVDVLAKKWNQKRGFYSDIFSSNKMLSSEQLPDVLPHTSILKKEYDQYFFCIPFDYIPKKNPTNKIAFIDPGEVTFLTIYDTNGIIISAGDKIHKLLMYLLKQLHKLQQKVARATTHKKRYSLKRALRRLRLKIRHLVDELHKKLTKYLTTEYDYIIIPKLNFHKLKHLPKIHKEVLVALRHCEFVDRLVMKTKENQHCKVITNFSEAHSSKTCCKCGNIKNDLDKERTYVCDKCKTVIERDYNGSLGNGLRQISHKFKQFILK